MSLIRSLVLLISTVTLLSQNNHSIIIGEKVIINSKILGEEKEIYISLPHKYQERVHSYPVIFTLEAEFLFESVKTISSMMAARSKMPQSIVVGLLNGQFKKRHELGYKKWGGKPDQYIAFFKEELIPFIKKNYRANDFRTIIGLSPTTGFVLEAMLDHPTLFKGYISLSTHFEWPREEGLELIDEILSITGEDNYPKNTLYFSRADSDLKEKPFINEKYREAQKKLAERPDSNAKIKIDVIEDDEHYLMLLAGLRNGFKLMYPNSLWRNPGIYGWDKNYNYAKEYYQSYYDNLSNMYGFDIYPVEDGHSYGFHFTGFIHNAMRWGSTKQASDLIELGLTYYPNSATLHMYRAELQHRKNEQTRAKKSAKIAIELARKYDNENIKEYEDRLKRVYQK